MSIWVIHGRRTWHPPYSRVSKPRRRKKPTTNYARLPKSKPSKRARKGAMSNRNNAFYQTFVTTSPSGVTTENRVRYRDKFDAVNARSGNFKDPTPHSYVHTQIWYPNGTRNTSTSTSAGPFGEDYGYILDESEAVSTAAIYNQTLTKLYQQLRDSDLNLSVDVAEWKQLDRMLEKTKMRTIPRLIAFAKRAKRKQRPGMTMEEAKNAIGNSWLEYRYGWRPLLSSIYGLVNFERSIASHRKLMARTTSKVSWHRAIAASGSTPPCSYDVRHSRRCEIGITYRVDQPWLFDATRIVSLNPVAIAWELLPYSFVVDWFLDIGGYMQNLEQSLFLGLTFERGYVTYTDKVEVTGRYQGTWGSSGNSINAPFRTRLTRLGRTPLSAPPRPKMPHFEPHLGWQRMLSAAALLNQILSPDPKLFRR